MKSKRDLRSDFFPLGASAVEPCDTPTDACVLGDLAMKENLLGEPFVWPCFRLLWVRGVSGASGEDGPPSLDVPRSSPSAGVSGTDIMAGDLPALAVPLAVPLVAPLAAPLVAPLVAPLAPRAVSTRPFSRSLFRSLGSRNALCCADLRSGDGGMPGSPRSSGGGNCTPLSSRGGDVPVAP